jgi:AraC-like DNA-binding protein
LRDFLVEPVDDAAAAELVAARGATAQRAAALADAPRLLRLTEPLQLRTWAEVVWRPDSKLTTGELARTFSVSREYLSREFGAGGAPNLKRVIDLARVLCAADLLANPGYTVATVSRVLGYSSTSHFGGCVRRICGSHPAELPGLGLRGVLARFLEGRTRSRG